MSVRHASARPGLLTGTPVVIAGGCRSKAIHALARSARPAWRLTRYDAQLCTTCVATGCLFSPRASAVSSKRRGIPAPTEHAGALLCRSSPSTAEAGTLILGRRRSKSSQCHQGQLGSAPLQFRLVQHAATSRECCQRCLVSSLDQVGLNGVRAAEVRSACLKQLAEASLQELSQPEPPVRQAPVTFGARYCYMHT